jgi:transcriptional regulator with XRE-family HTH domain
MARNANEEDDMPTGSAGVAEERNARRPNPMDAHVGSRVRMRRMLLGLSQEKLGELLGLTFQQVQKYEKGANRIGASRLFDLSHVLGVPVQYFYDEAPAAIADGFAAGPGMAERGTEPYVADVLASRDGIELNKAFARIGDARVRRAIVDLVKSLAGDADHG